LKTVVGLFDDWAQAKKAALDVEAEGIPHNDISIVANNEGGKYVPTDGSATPDTTTTGNAIGQDALVGAGIGGVAGLLVGLSGVVIPGLGWIAGAGWLMATLVGAGTGAVVGGLIGALSSVGVPEEEAAYYTEGVRRGGILLAIKAPDNVAHRVAQIIGDDGAVNIEERAAQYRQEGFQPTTFTGASTSYSRDLNEQPFSGSEHTSRTRSYEALSPDFRNDYQTRYASQGGAFEQYEPAYRYGYELSGRPKYWGQSWSSIEPEVRQSWESRQPNTWDRFKNSIRFAWEKATGADRGGIQTGGRAYDGTADTRGVSEKMADAVTGDRIDDKTGKPVA